GYRRAFCRRRGGGKKRLRWRDRRRRGGWGRCGRTGWPPWSSFWGGHRGGRTHSGGVDQKKLPSPFFFLSSRSLHSLFSSSVSPCANPILRIIAAFLARSMI